MMLVTSIKATCSGAKEHWHQAQEGSTERPLKSLNLTSFNKQATAEAGPTGTTTPPDQYTADTTPALEWQLRPLYTNTPCIKYQTWPEASTSCLRAPHQKIHIQKSSHDQFHPCSRHSSDGKPDGKTRLRLSCNHLSILW